MSSTQFDGDIDSFVSYLKSNRGLSANTLKAYRADLTACLPSIHPRHHHVQNGHIQSRTAVLQNIQRFLSIGGFDDGMTVPLEKVADQTTDTRLIVCD